jgi:dienelactone hydrolase
VPGALRPWLCLLLLAAGTVTASCAVAPGAVPEHAAAPVDAPASTPGTPVIPSPVTIALVLDGRATRADFHHPAVPSDSAVILAHGFTRSRATMAGHAARLAQAGMLAVAPDLPYLIDSRDNARALADLVAQLRSGRHAPAVQRVVLVGFSAGGLAALLAAGSEGVVGFVGLDPFDRPSRIGRQFAQTLQVPAALLRGPPAACNAYAIAAPWAQALPRIETDRLFDQATHCDFEDPSDWVCRLACGAADPRRQQAIAAELLRIVTGWLRPLAGR